MRRWMSRAQRAVGDRVEVRRRVNEPQVVPRRRRRLGAGRSAETMPVGEDALPQPRVLRHRELVAFRQRQDEVSE